MEDIKSTLESLLGDKDNASFQQDLVQLWRRWPEIIGAETAQLVKPLGHRQATLILGAQDAVTLQEASFAQEEILEEIAAFFGRQPFDKVKFELLSNRTPLSELQVGPEVIPPNPGQIPDVGNLPLEGVEANSAFASCYRAYVRYWEKRRNNEPSHR
ncbi:MAG: DUF721 domain-containing protein [Thermodesulfobacteriota bacterium]